MHARHRTHRAGEHVPCRVDLQPSDTLALARGDAAHALPRRKLQFRRVWLERVAVRHERARTWTGAACEKEDFSSQTLLIIGTIAVLFVSTVFSIALLYREGTQELPGTLASVSLGPQ